MQQQKEVQNKEVLGVEEYLMKRKKIREEERKKEQEKSPVPISVYSSLCLFSSFLFVSL